MLDEHIEEIPSYIQVDSIILPEQYADLMQPSEASPERRLLVALLRDAVHCYLARPAGPAKLRKGERDQLQKEAAWWIFGPVSTPDIFTFMAVCEALNINAEVLRAQLIKLHAAGETVDLVWRTPVESGHR